MWIKKIQLINSSRNQLIGWKLQVIHNSQSENAPHSMLPILNFPCTAKCAITAAKIFIAIKFKGK